MCVCVCVYNMICACVNQSRGRPTHQVLHCGAASDVVAGVVGAAVVIGSAVVVGVAVVIGLAAVVGAALVVGAAAVMHTYIQTNI